jgi:hypothetical protein
VVAAQTVVGLEARDLVSIDAAGAARITVTGLAELQQAELEVAEARLRDTMIGSIVAEVLQAHGYVEAAHVVELWFYDGPRFVAHPATRQRAAQFVRHYLDREVKAGRLARATYHGRPAFEQTARAQINELARAAHAMDAVAEAEDEDVG